MRLIPWLRSLKSQIPAGRRQSRHRAGRGRLELEALEDRYCPSGGLLDTTFNGTGTQFLPNSVGGYALPAIYPGGKIVTEGNVPDSSNYNEISVTRLNPNGTLDTTFNGTGSVVIQAGYYTGGGAVAIQPDGKILVGGRVNPNRPKAFRTLDTEFMVARLNANGSLDKTFGDKGIFVYHPMADDVEHVTGLAILADGSILVGGGGHQEGFVLMKLTSKGSLNTTFGSGGVAENSVVDADMNAMAVVPGTGQIVTAGTSAAGVASQAMVVVFTAGGQLDTSFNGTGYVVASTNPSNTFVGVALQGNATQGYKIVVAGNVSVTRYFLSGALDTTFGGAGTGYFAVPLLNPSDPSTTAALDTLALEPDGSILIGGSQTYLGSDNNYHNEMMVGHLSVDGTLDTTFGPNGTGFSYAPPSTTSLKVNSLAIDPSDNRIVACGNDPSIVCFTLS